MLNQNMDIGNSLNGAWIDLKRFKLIKWNCGNLDNTLLETEKVECPKNCIMINEGHIDGICKNLNIDFYTMKDIQNLIMDAEIKRFENEGEDN